MSRGIARKFPEEMPPGSEKPVAALTEDRKRQLAKILEHQEKIELDLDQAKLARLRANHSNEERFWAGQGEARLETFERKTSLPHKAVWS